MFDLKTTFFIAVMISSLSALSANAQSFVMGQMTTIETNTGSMAAGGSGASSTGYVSQNTPTNAKQAAHQAKQAAQQAAFNASLATMTPAQKAVAIAAQQAKQAAKQAAAQAAKTAKSNAAVAAQRAATGNIFGPYDPNGFQPPSFIQADQVIPPPIGVGLWADGYGGDN
jgi:multidrug efflux pump subunit AcrA (membrane-fusion protein)